jgi:lysophospholipase L1-like esterase
VKILLGLLWCCFAVLSHAQVADPSLYLTDLTKELDVAWPKNRTIRVVCHGHSVPSGYTKTPLVEPFSAYPHLLHRALHEQHPHAVINVIVTAKGGENSREGAKRFARDVLSLRPDVVMIDYSLNDRSIGLAEAKRHWESMILAAQAAGCRVMLLTPTGDSSAKMLDPNDALSQHAAQVRSLAEKHRVALVDSYRAYQDWLRAGKELAPLMSHVNHPSRQGHELVLHELLRWFHKSDR